MEFRIIQYLVFGVKWNRSKTERTSETEKHSFSLEQEARRRRVDPDSLNVGRWIGGGSVTRTVRRY